jgi:hypothetical protein
MADMGLQSKAILIEAGMKVQILLKSPELPRFI